MKTFRYIDVTIQSILIVFAVGFLIGASGKIEVQFLTVQLLFGAYQMTFGFFYLLALRGASRPRLFHFVTGLLWIAFLAVNSSIDNKTLAQFLMVVPSWCLGFYYYYISIRGILNPPNRGKFLPHLSF